MSTLSGQVALVTGSSRGIGAAIADEFARRGALVAVHGRDLAAVRDVAVAGRGGRVIGVTGELTDFTQVEAVRRQVEAELGPAPRLRRHHRLGGGPARRSALPHPVRRRQGGNRAAHAAGRGPGRPVRHPGQLHRAGDDPD